MSMWFCTGCGFAKTPLFQHIWHSRPRKQAGLTPELVMDWLRPLAFMLLSVSSTIFTLQWCSPAYTDGQAWTQWAC